MLLGLLGEELDCGTGAVVEMLPVELVVPGLPAAMDVVAVLAGSAVLVR